MTTALDNINFSEKNTLTTYKFGFGWVKSDVWYCIDKMHTCYNSNGCQKQSIYFLNISELKLMTTSGGLLTRRSTDRVITSGRILPRKSTDRMIIGWKPAEKDH